MVTNPNYPYNYMKTHNFIDSAVLHGPNEYFNFDDDSLRLLFFNDLYRPLRWPYPKGPHEEMFAGAHTRLNKDGFRCDDFEKGTEVLFSGCSQTYGMGVPEEYSWPSVTTSLINKTTSNLGAPGASWPMIVNNLYAYFRKYGHPKAIAVVFPNTERLQIPINKNILVNEFWGVRDREKDIDSWDSLGDEYLQLTYPTQFPGPKYSMRPHIAKEVISHDYVYYLCIQSVNHLEQYCEAAGIKFIWTTWDFMTGRSIEKMRGVDPSYFRGYFDLKMDHWCHPVQQTPDLYHPEPLKEDDECLKEQPCDRVQHCHKDLENKAKEIFSIAYDNGHWGTHRHAHVGEAMAEMLKTVL